MHLPMPATARGRIIAALALTTALACGLELLPAAPASKHHDTPTAAASINDPQQPLSVAQIASDIGTAQKAIAAQIGQPPYSGEVSRKPDFVSALEWQIFLGVARTHRDPAQELTLLVNRLRFTRLEALWRSLQPHGEDADLRHRLAQQLLDEIPGRVRAAQFDRAQAQTLQLELVEDLVSDPRERIERVSNESRRLG
jgi:hypothetical protein